MIKEYKDWLFVTVPEDASSQIDLVGFETMELKFIITKITNGKPSFHNKYIFLPPGSYQIIGKGDAIDWEGIVDSMLVNGIERMYANYLLNDKWATGKPLRSAIPSGHSLLRSLGMEPSETLVLKKNEK